jgi:hypothetical protein
MLAGVNIEADAKAAEAPPAACSRLASNYRSGPFVPRAMPLTSGNVQLGFASEVIYSHQSG